MKVRKTKLKGVFLITPPTIFKDFRGEYVEIYNKDFFHNKKINTRFKQDDISVSKKNVLRGIHGDYLTTKLISCLYGSFYLVVVNNDPKSPQYKQFISFILSEKNRLQVLVPPKFGNGHLVLTKQAIFHYKQNTNYHRASQFTIKWNDPNYNFKWPVKYPILSQRDK
jgi:dTDP-4-dehydrorhamnose 3,5-epimerase